MELSKRLQTIVNNIDKCDSIADIGTDHGYVPIYCVKNEICSKAIASDINKGPIEKAKFNVAMDGLEKSIECRLGPGLSTLKVNEVEAIVIAGMGGNLTRDILLEDIDKIKKCSFIILQPAQNPEVLREFLYTSKFEVLDEDICLDEGKYYELFKVRFNEHNKPLEFDDSIYFEISPVILKKNNETFMSFINSKISKYESILSFIKEDTIHAKQKRTELEVKISKLKEIL
ncbi:tRNA (adenine(22)-N(1))-methyltransferase [Clostridium folliculivorans]|uniref:SAM-dependent methyltransferase n=1 Tax=Clostridium folliculivorans TaxID=2886038 RepID=A0A9W5XZ51_9CLOT|nr:class I SAM-dependent methyltransferase [Clostridium folliculivorans]GKU23647.1 SAM-dependent methyltransferase [Clostridium folliculivorans]GKU29763.1 SAM-dependent methyltransferase [Clostridium folliculivorans]